MKEFFKKVGLGEAAVAIETIANTLNVAFDVILQPNMKLDEVAEIYSKKIDEIILNDEKSNNHSYVGGMFNILYIDAVSFETSYELYFQNDAKEWVKKEAKSKPQKISFLHAEALAELKMNKKVSFEIKHPNIGDTGSMENEK